MTTAAPGPTTRTARQRGAARGTAVLSFACTLAAAVLLYQAADGAVVQAVRTQFGAGADSSVVPAVTGAVTGVVLALGGAFATVATARRTGEPLARARLRAGTVLAALGAALLALLFLLDSAVGAAAEVSGRPAIGTGPGEGVLIVAAVVLIAVGVVVVLRVIARLRDPSG